MMIFNRSNDDDCDGDVSQRHTDSPSPYSLGGKVKSPLSQIIDSQHCTEEVMMITMMRK